MADDEHDDEDEEEEEKTAFTRVVKPAYCPVTSMPHEFSEFDPQFEESKKRFKDEYQQHFPEVTDEEALCELMLKLGYEGEKDAAALKAQGGKKPKAVGGEGGGGGGKKKPPAQVVIELTSRNKKKHITCVRGLEAFGVDMADAAKPMGKKFASGSAFQKGKHGQPDQIEIQGNFIEELPAFLLAKFKISEEACKIVDSSKSKKGGGGGAAGSGEAAEAVD